MTILLDGVAALVNTPERVPMPSWIDETVYSGLIVSTANGLLDVARRELLLRSAGDPNVRALYAHGRLCRGFRLPRGFSIPRNPQ